MPTTVSLGHSRIRELYGMQLLDLIPDQKSDERWALVFQGGKDGIGFIEKCANAEHARGKTLLRHVIHSDRKGLDLLFSDDVCVTVESNLDSLLVTTGYQLPTTPLRPRPARRS
jgi:hypothetical protein